MCRIVFAALVIALLPSPVRAGLHFSGEPYAELPSQWRGFLVDHRALRLLAVPTGDRFSGSALLEPYRDARQKLETIAARRPLTASETADLGALHLRLGQVDRAVQVLRDGQRLFPDDFAILANLGTAWQVQGDLDEAALTLRQAVRQAPARWKADEELHLRLVELRRREPRGSDGLDDLFGVRYVGPSGQAEAGKLAEAEQKKLPADAIARLQQLALWLPADGRLLWQLGELANARGDVRSAAAMLEGCASEFRLGHPELRRRRQIYRDAAQEEATGQTDKARQQHETHAARLGAKSARPLIRKLQLASLPAIQPDGINLLPWTVLGETTIERPFRPGFPRYLLDLDGKRVTLTGFMQPIGEDLEMTTFLFIEFPVGCWFCETPDLSGMLLVELAGNRSVTLRKGLVKVEGWLKLNRTDPEDFLFHLRDAALLEVD